MLDRTMLRDLGVTSMGEALCILKQAKEAAPQATHAAHALFNKRGEL